MFKDKDMNPIAIFITAFISIVLMAVTMILSNEIVPKWYGLPIGILLMVIAIPIHIWAKKHNFGYTISYILNSIGNGFSISAYYTVKKVPINIPQVLLVITGFLAAFSLVAIITYHRSQLYKMAFIAFTMILIMLLAACLGFWIINGSTLYSFGFFSIIIVLTDVLSLGQTRIRSKIISLSSFGIFILISLVVLTILTEGEILSELDFGGSIGHRKSKYRTR